MTIVELYNKISEICPKTLSCSWDNDGIMLSNDVNAEIKRVLVSLDATYEAVNYAAGHGFDVLLTHHPMLFRSVKSVTPQNLSGKRILRGISSGLSVLSFHTRLDACDGGVNDALCLALSRELKDLSVIGKFGDEESPTIGRICEINPTSAEELAKKVKLALGCGTVRLNGSPMVIVKKIGVCGGDGKDFIYPALMSGCDAFITGDAGYNMAGDAQEEGIVTIEAGHYHSEAPILDVLERFARDFAGAEVERYNSCTYSVI